MLSLDAGLNDCGIRIADCGMKIKNPKSKIQNAITGCWIKRLRNSARLGADLRITLQHCLQTKTRQIAHYNVNGLGQGLRNAE